MAAFMEESGVEVRRRYSPTAEPARTCCKLMALHQHPSAHFQSLRHQRHILKTARFGHLASLAVVRTGSKKAGKDDGENPYIQTGLGDYVIDDIDDAILRYKFKVDHPAKVLGLTESWK